MPIPTSTPNGMRYTGVCDNCGERSGQLVRHKLPHRENHMKAGAVVYDCPLCYKKYWMPTTVQEQVDQEVTQAMMEEAKPKYQPPMYCTGCNLKVPYKLVTRPHPGNLLGMAPQMYPDLTGWMVIEFPYVDPYHAKSMEGVHRSLKEADKLCPKCALSVKGTITYLKEK